MVRRLLNFGLTHLKKWKYSQEKHLLLSPYSIYLIVIGFVYHIITIDRIDTLELFAVIILALPSDLELKLSRN